MKKETKYGFVMEIDEGGQIISLAREHCITPVIKLGQEVKSNGDFIAPLVEQGMVTKIHEPYSKGWTDEIIEVMFNSFSYQARDSRKISLNMKITELL